MRRWHSEGERMDVILMRASERRTCFLPPKASQLVTSGARLSVIETMSSERADFRSDIEGLRGLAILLVVLFHAGVSRLAGGYVGVDVFFVLSGFFITGLLAREVAATGDIDLPEFYARRARRLLPAFLVVLLATVALTLWIYAPIDQPTVASDARAVALQYGNVLFADNAVNYHAASANPFLHTWSLAVEQQFYVLWPLLFALIGRIYGASGVTPRRLIAWVTAAGVLSFVVSLWVTKIAQPWAFFGMPTRIWEFALGGVTALALAHQPKEVGKGGIYYQLAGLIAIGVASLSYHQATAYPGVAAIAPALGAVALLIGGHRAPNSAVSKALGSRLLQWFGRMSYSWYLWHWPLVGIGAVIDWDIGVVGRLAWSGVALVLAVLTHRFIEKPWREGAGIKRSPQVVTAVAFGASIVAALARAWRDGDGRTARGVAGSASVRDRARRRHGARLLGLAARERDGALHLWRHDVAHHRRALGRLARRALAARRRSHRPRAPLEDRRDGEAGVPRRGHAGARERAPQARLRRVHASGVGRCCGGSSRCIRRSRFSRAGITTCRPTETDRSGR